MERTIRSVTFGMYGLGVGAIAVGVLRPAPVLGWPLALAAIACGFRIGQTRPMKGQPNDSPRATRIARATLALAAVGLQSYLVYRFRDEDGGWVFVPISGWLGAVALVFAALSANSRRNTITLLGPVWIIEVVMLSGFVFPGLFVAPTTIAATLAATIPDSLHRQPRARRAAASAEQWVLRAAFVMVTLDLASLLFWYVPGSG